MKSVTRIVLLAALVSGAMTGFVLVNAAVLARASTAEVGSR